MGFLRNRFRFKRIYRADADITSQFLLHGGKYYTLAFWRRFTWKLTVFRNLKYLLNKKITGRGKTPQKARFSNSEFEWLDPYKLDTNWQDSEFQYQIFEFRKKIIFRMRRLKTLSKMRQRIKNFLHSRVPVRIKSWRSLLTGLNKGLFGMHTFIRIVDCRFSALLLRIGIFRSIYSCQQWIRHGYVLLNSVKCFRCSKQVHTGDVVTFDTIVENRFKRRFFLNARAFLILNMIYPLFIYFSYKNFFLTILTSFGLICFTTSNFDLFGLAPTLAYSGSYAMI